ncbi:hypothetical protein ACFL1R_04275 [Candidatus Latescibacterota bacterium]
MTVVIPVIFTLALNVMNVIIILPSLGYGHEAKRSVGERKDVPGVAHNLALNEMNVSTQTCTDCNELVDSTATKRSEEPCNENKSNGHLGFQAGAVVTDSYDTGFGCGARYSRQFFQTSLKHNSVFHFWGASNDSSDVTAAGLEETIIYNVPVDSRLAGYAGLTCGFCYYYKKTRSYKNDTYKINENKYSSFNIFVVIGTEYELLTGHSIFGEYKYGIISDYTESQIVIGLNISLDNLRKKTEE